MRAAESMKELLRPLGVYRLEDSFLEMELETVGAALDGARERLETIQREACLLTARNEGIEAVAGLLRRRPVTETPAETVAALTALLRIGAGSFTPEAINDTAAGCGLTAEVTERQEPGTVQVRLHNTRGIPDGIEEIRAILEEILPAHVEITYKFLYQVWAQLNNRELTWNDLHQAGVTWDELEKMTD